MTQQHTFALLSFIRTHRSNTRGEAAIYLRITVDGKPVEISTKCHIDPNQWNSQKGRVKGNSEKARTINHCIETLEMKARQHYNRLSYI